MAEALALRHVSAGYGDTVVLEDVSLALEAGESISVIGRNGVGKSTLLATVMGHTTLHGGEVLLGGASLARAPVFRRARSGLGFVPQEREIFPSLTVRENLAVGARPGPWTAERVFDLFPNLGARLSHAGSLLSGGEQQMLSIVLVEQNSRVALAFSARTVVMDKGRIVYDGASAALAADPERLAKLIGVE